MNKPTLLINPYHRKLAFGLALLFPGVTLGIEVAELIGLNLQLGFFGGGLPACALALFYGKCQHCEEKLPLTIWVGYSYDTVFPPVCPSCKQSYSIAKQDQN